MVKIPDEKTFAEMLWGAVAIVRTALHHVEFPSEMTPLFEETIVSAAAFSQLQPTRSVVKALFTLSNPTFVYTDKGKRTPVIGQAFKAYNVIC